jgi:hypothetical protein
MGNSHTTTKSQAVAVSHGSHSIIEACQMRDLEVRMVRDRSERKYLQHSPAGKGHIRKPVMSIMTDVVEDVDDCTTTSGGYMQLCYSPSGSDDHETSIRTLRQVLPLDHRGSTPIAMIKGPFEVRAPERVQSLSSMRGSNGPTPEMLSCQQSRPSTSAAQDAHQNCTTPVNPLAARLLIK